MPATGKLHATFAKPASVSFTRQAHDEIVRIGIFEGLNDFVHATRPY